MNITKMIAPFHPSKPNRVAELKVTKLKEVFNKEGLTYSERKYQQRTDLLRLDKYLQS